MKTTLLIDADIIAYKASACLEEQFEFGVRVGDVEEAYAMCRYAVDTYKEQLGADDAVLCLSDKQNFRKEVLPSYKSNRADVKKPQLLHTVRQYLQDNFRSCMRSRLEGDDVMGILSTHPTLIKGRKIVVSIDKDMKTIPGWLFNPDKDNEPYEVGRDQADLFHMIQTLTGDNVDGYKGCPGIGKMKAVSILSKQPKHMWWQLVVDCYHNKGLTEDDALQQARVARILRNTDYNFKTKEIILWKPN